MNRDKYIGLFASLGERLSGFGDDGPSRRALDDAMKDNPWFTRGDIIEAVEAIRTDILQPGILTEWLGHYHRDVAGASRRRDIAVIMAGNIPLVGFSDLLCVIAAGGRCHVKMSGKDSVLMKYVVGIMRDIDPEVPIEEYREGGHYDAVIATGSDNTNRYFRSAFAGIPSLLRGSRSSVAVLEGGESESTLWRLSGDIFRYSGLGCRNVSLVFVPRDYDIDRLGRAITPVTEDLNPGYLNNYTQNKALLTVKGDLFSDFGCFLMQERVVFTDPGRAEEMKSDPCSAKDVFPMNISSINYCRYDRVEEVGEWLAANDGAIQCVVTDISHFAVFGQERNFMLRSVRPEKAHNSHSRAVTFGRAHHPRPWDYPDGRDVMDFLYGLI